MRNGYIPIEKIGIWKKRFGKDDLKKIKDLFIKHSGIEKKEWENIDYKNVSIQHFNRFPRPETDKRDGYEGVMPKTVKKLVKNFPKNWEIIVEGALLYLKESENLSKYIDEEGYMCWKDAFKEVAKELIYSGRYLCEFDKPEHVSLYLKIIEKLLKPYETEELVGLIIDNPDLSKDAISNGFYIKEKFGTGLENALTIVIDGFKSQWMEVYGYTPKIKSVYRFIDPKIYSRKRFEEAYKILSARFTLDAFKNETDEIQGGFCIMYSLFPDEAPRVAEHIEKNLFDMFCEYANRIFAGLLNISYEKKHPDACFSEKGVLSLNKSPVLDLLKRELFKKSQLNPSAVKLALTNKYSDLIFESDYLSKAIITDEKAASLLSSETVRRICDENFENSYKIRFLENAVKTGINERELDELFGLNRLSSKKFSLPLIKGKEGEYRYEILEKSHPDAPFLGYFTDCCQVLGGSGDYCMRHGIKDKESGFFVVYKKDRVVAQSWLWSVEDESGKKALVFDSVEVLGRDLDKSKSIKECIQQAIKKLSSKYSLILIGADGNTIPEGLDSLIYKKVIESEIGGEINIVNFIEFSRLFQKVFNKISEFPYSDAKGKVFVGYMSKKLIKALKKESEAIAA